jgi:hypothetical protein
LVTLIAMPIACTRNHSEILMINSTRTALRSLVLLSCAFLIAACTSGPPTPTVDYKNDYNFMQVKKIALFKQSGQVSGDNPLQLSDIQRDRIDTALTYALGNRGFQIVDDTSQADLLLSWHLVTQHKTDVRTYETPAYGSSMGYGCVWVDSQTPAIHPLEPVWAQASYRSNVSSCENFSAKPSGNLNSLCIDWQIAC